MDEVTVDENGRTNVPCTRCETKLHERDTFTLVLDVHSPVVDTYSMILCGRCSNDFDDFMTYSCMAEHSGPLYESVDGILGEMYGAPS